MALRSINTTKNILKSSKIKSRVELLGPNMEGSHYNFHALN